MKFPQISFNEEAKELTLEFKEGCIEVTLDYSLVDKSAYCHITDLNRGNWFDLENPVDLIKLLEYTSACIKHQVILDYETYTAQ
jgi:hypothetical protein